MYLHTHFGYQGVKTNLTNDKKRRTKTNKKIFDGAKKNKEGEWKKRLR